MICASIKIRLFIIIISCFLCCCRDSSLKNYPAEKVNPCKYFKLKFAKINGKLTGSFSWKVKEVEHDYLSNFIRDHEQRFMYIVINKCGNISQYFQQFPDTAKINSMFCSDLQSKQFLSYFLTLCNLKTIGNTSLKEAFTIEEVIQIASRFYYLDEPSKINPGKKPQHEIYHKVGCVGINGIKEFKVFRDYSIIEAFCFEAIMKNNSIRKSHSVRNFENYIEEARKVKVDTSIIFHSAVIRLRNKLFKLMETDKALKNELRNFYKKNVDNLGFVINDI